jgi:hypothetical protein
LTYRTIIQKLEKNDRKVVLFFFAAFLLISLFVVKDFGMSWDERYQRDNNGYANWEYIFHGNSKTLLAGEDKYHGPVFEIFLIGVEKLFHLEDLRSIFLMRHTCTFLLFYVSSVFFYSLSLKIFNKTSIAFIGLLMYVLSPHIFSHAFYNSKDIVFLSLFTISAFTFLWFLEKRNVVRAIVLAFVAAITTDVRIIGILVPAFFIYESIIAAARNPLNSTLKTYLIPFLTFFGSLVAFTILFWPVLWLGPLHHFFEALKENSNYPWQSPVLYFGKEYAPAELPWHYLFFWMFISRPVVYSLLFIVGVSVLLIKFIRNPRSFILGKKTEQLILFWFFLPLLAMFVFKSPAFDTGRHLYFLHGAFVLISLYGTDALLTAFKHKKAFNAGFSAILMCSFFLVIFRMAALHPFEHLYFNQTMQKEMSFVKNNFEFDYWGLTQRNTLEGLLSRDSSSQITIQAENAPGVLNSYLLKPADRQRIVYSKNRESAGYLLADYRWKKEGDYGFKKEVYSTLVGDAKASTVFRLRSSEELWQMKGKKVALYSNDFERDIQDWSNTQRIENSQSHSGNHVTKVDQNTTFSDAFQPNDISAIAANKNLFLRMETWIMDGTVGSSYKIIISLQDQSEKVYFYESIYEGTDKKLKSKEWQLIKAAVELPAIRSGKDKLKIYLMSTSDKEVLMDDMTLEFVEELPGN